MSEKEHSLAATFLGVVLAASFLAASASADEEGYIDNWPGNIRLELASPGQPEAIPLPAERAGPSLSDRLRLAWADFRPTFCDRIRGRFEARGSVRAWLYCDLAAAGELRGRQLNPSLFPNRLDLKYVVSGNRIGFVSPTPGPLPASTDPGIQAEFAVVLRLTLVFDAELNVAQLPDPFDPPPDPPDPPEPYLQGPISMISASIGFAGARFTSTWDVIPLLAGQIAPELRGGESGLNATTEDLKPDMIPLRKMNIELDKGAIELRRALETEDDRAPLFYLTTSIRESDYFIRFFRLSRPAVPLPGCSCSSECSQQIYCICRGAGVLQENEQVLLQRLMAGGAWKPSGLSDRGSWSVNGDALGAAGGEEVTVRLCRVSQWGRNCDQPLTFVYRDLGTCSGVPPDPTPTPICPQGMRPCPGHGCLSFGMTCSPPM
ncbi:hypothetical protein [Bradyrhizobium sp. AUGA SZCCT0283]|uniref:hypothetical protein n=1 Tax=Bradyrhizobium sp. AUGA SZCCT0283 TaxID=2807671 RepID=UPI001BADAEB6|nr:hypothetical protein [Bradyrhizobium sp. AUGA SZCCT0283]MBR1274253.1 hypothetical protein [Bradyrhizobium sp. AUGA SZCCT0283]